MIDGNEVWWTLSLIDDGKETISSVDELPKPTPAHTNSCVYIGGHWKTVFYMERSTLKQSDFCKIAWDSPSCTVFVVLGGILDYPLTLLDGFAVQQSVQLLLDQKVKLLQRAALLQSWFRRSYWFYCICTFTVNWSLFSPFSFFLENCHIERDLGLTHSLLFRLAALYVHKMDLH